MCSPTFNKLHIPDGGWSTQSHLTREGSIHPLLHSYTWAPSNVHLLISLQSGRLSHLEMVFCPSLFPPTQQWLKERSQALFEPPHLCAQVQLCFWFINSFLTRSFPVLYPFSNMWHAEREMGNFPWYMQMIWCHNTVTENPMIAH